MTTELERHLAKAREIAKRSKPVFVDIPRLTRFTAHENTRKLFAAEQAARATALLEAEQRRLINEWRK